MDPALWAQLKAEQTARIQADREAEAERMARLTPVTDAELARYGTRSPRCSLRPRRRRHREPARPDYEAARSEVADLSARVDQLAEQEAERRAEMDEAAVNEPVVHEPGRAGLESMAAWRCSGLPGAGRLGERRA